MMKNTHKNQGPATLAAARAHWARLAAREQTLVLAAAGLVLLALAWWLLLAPAWSTWKTSAARHAQADAQLRQMQLLQAEARQLQEAPRAQGGSPGAALQASVAQALGRGGQIALAGERATVTLRAVPAAAVARWLAQARSAARAVPLEAQLTRDAGTDAAWSGTVVLALPAP
ncbi:type II secretion system protein GspM [Pulveribacter suum]|uniref:General secretion pathway protein GspM n=1 Tax=Pulveribacter suum TaxID=2116657 RepID=A0A2P1NNY0_9BURK|nr:type II secretion system protein GspM [Pulveribacter suum]AVP58769.1 general secretion pathway protein GspM [Pulveribacter suum]